MFVLACDLPRVDEAVIARVLRAGNLRTEADGTATARIAVRGGRKQPLCGLFSPACGPEAARLLDAGRRSVHDLLGCVEVELVSFDDLARDPFLNVNTPADYELAGGAPGAVP